MTKRTFAPLKYFLRSESVVLIGIFLAVIAVSTVFSWLLAVNTSISGVAVISIYFVAFVTSISINNAVHNCAISFSCTRRSVFICELIYKFLFSSVSALLMLLIFALDKLINSNVEGFVSYTSLKDLILIFFVILFLYSVSEFISIVAFRFGRIVMTIVMMLFGGICGGCFSIFINDFNAFLSLIMSLPLTPVIITGICTAAAATLANFLFNRKYCVQ